MNLTPITNNTIFYTSTINRNYISIYWLILIFIIICSAALPFINLDISVKSFGIIRPIDEKTELKSSISKMIDTLIFKEGDTVRQGDIIIQIRKENIAIKKTINDFEITSAT